MILFNSKAFSQTVGTEAPDFTLNTLSHGTISLSDYREKVV
jgi:peroxiredoxin